MIPTKPVTIVLVITAFVFLGASVFVQQSQKQLALSLQVKIVEQEKTLTTLAELTDQNRADSVAESIIRDCSTSNRERFEDLLNRLATLSTVELNEIDKLFEACAGFFAQRKAIMVSRLQREFEVYRDYVSLYAQLDGRAPVIEFPVAIWERLTLLEQERGALLNEQVEIQAEIIDNLQLVVPAQDDLEEKLVRAQQVAARVADLNKSIDEVRTELQDV